MAYNVSTEPHFLAQRSRCCTRFKPSTSTPFSQAQTPQYISNPGKRRPINLHPHFSLPLELNPPIPPERPHVRIPPLDPVVILLRRPQSFELI